MDDYNIEEIVQKITNPETVLYILNSFQERIQILMLERKDNFGLDVTCMNYDYERRLLPALLSYDSKPEIAKYKDNIESLFLYLKKNPKTKLTLEWINENLKT